MHGSAWETMSFPQLTPFPVTLGGGAAVVDPFSMLAPVPLAAVIHKVVAPFNSNVCAFDGCCGFFGLFGCVLKVVLPDVSPVSVAGIFRGQEPELCLCSVAACWIVECL